MDKTARSFCATVTVIGVVVGTEAAIAGGVMSGIVVGVIVMIASALALMDVFFPEIRENNRKKE